MARRVGKAEVNKTTRRVVHKEAGPAKGSQSRRDVAIPKSVTVKDLAALLDVTGIEAIKHLMRNGIMANINQVIDFETAAKVASDLGFAAVEAPVSVAEMPESYRFIEEEGAAQKPRPPVVTIMGHVDHGKTKLLDAIRKTNVVATEAGNITQHIGAYQVEVRSQKITFLDTPGHEAFTAMRARGAKVTDIAILVVAADDGVMPQTQEAIDHAKAAEVPIVVAINKIDKPEANVDRVKQQLADSGLLIEEWGGEVVCAAVSAKTGEGLGDLLDNLLIVAEILELTANPARRAVGVAIEASLDSTKGSLATILVQTGTLSIGDNILVGTTWGKVKAMFDDKGKRVKRATPSMPVEVLGLNGVPHAGDIMSVVTTEKEARTEGQRRLEERAQTTASRAPSLSNVYAQIQSGRIKELNIILKTDVQGSLDPIRSSLERLGGDEVKVRLVRSGTGSITENDVMLAIACEGIVIGFNSRPEPGAKILADSEGVDIRSYDVIYKLVEDVDKALVGLLEPTYVDVVEGHGEVRAMFSVRQGKIACTYVTDGKLTRGGMARVLRNGEPIHESTISSLKHFKENVREMATGFECGVGIEGFSDVQVGDIIEAYRSEKSS
jgi:translation initiation factor IF-2